MTPMKFNDSKGCVTKALEIEPYINGLEKFLNTQDFYEYGLNYEIKVFGDIAHVYSEYEAKRNKDDKDLIKKGINLIQLINNGYSWKIHSMLWQDI